MMHIFKIIQNEFYDTYLLNPTHLRFRALTSYKRLAKKAVKASLINSTSTHKRKTRVITIKTGIKIKPE
jgi:hypothetical protein